MYHIGVSKRGRTIIVQAVENVDQLSCEIYLYFGQRDVTKKHLRQSRKVLFQELVQKYPFRECTKIKVE